MPPQRPEVQLRQLRLRALSIVAMILLLAACSSGLEKELPELETTAATKKTESRISSDKDDAEERSSGLVINSSTDIELTDDRTRGQQLIGLRFSNVKVPRGATIKRAYIQFKADETDSGSITVRIRAEDTNNASSFPQGKNRSISKRSKTSASKSWKIPAWNKRGERGSRQRTADLSSLVKEVTSRKGWDQGNAMAFIISSADKNDRRVAESYRGDRKGAATLYVEYSGGNTKPSTPKPPSKPGKGVRIILDTDIGVDVDDAGALAVLHTLADRGEARILATVSNTHDPYAAAAIDAINTYYGRPNIPIGRNANKNQLPVATPWWRKNNRRFVRDLAERFPNNTKLSAVPPAVSVYRRALAAEPDGSVTVVSVGFMSNMADLLASKPDRYSRLNGRALVKRKVKELVIMGGSYPRSDRDLYLKGSSGKVPPTPAIRVLKDWPTTMTFAAGNVCGDIMTGQTLGKTPKSNPVREAYRLFFNRSGIGRDSWDLCAILYAVRGLSGPDGRYFAMHNVDKHLTLSKSGNSAWVSPGNGRHRRLTRTMSGKKIQGRLEALIVTPPRR